MNLLKKVSAVLIITLSFFSLNVYAQKGGQNMPDDLLDKIHILALNDWTPGGSQVCSWDWGKMTGNVKLTLWKGNLLVATLSPSCPVGMNGRGSITIQVPANLRPGEYELRIVSLSKPQIGDRRILKIIDKSTPKLTTPGSTEYKELKYDHKAEHKVGNEIKIDQQGFPKTAP